MGDCRSSKWVFDFAINEQGGNAKSVPATSVYSCKKIIERELDNSTGNDFAVIQLDRKVNDREPLKFRTEGIITQGTGLIVIGHPTGIPMKIADGASVRSVNDFYFVANLDTFGGNSGSAVFNADTCVVEGILVRGEQDYSYSSARGCYVPKQCLNSGCRGEDVTRITNLGLEGLL